MYIIPVDKSIFIQNFMMVKNDYPIYKPFLYANLTILQEPLFNPMYIIVYTVYIYSLYQIWYKYFAKTFSPVCNIFDTDV